ncbi:MAG: helicase HerA-like domain-containing protein [Acutalibacteraceae bacterium]
MFTDNKIWMAQGSENIYMLPGLVNRHGLIAGATGTGKTVTLKVMAESLSDCGVPVFVADVKGDLSGLAKAGVNSEKMQERISRFGIADFAYKPFPVRFWDVFGKGGHPLRTTVSEMGPTLLSRLLNLTDVQEGVLNIIFRVADDRGLLLIDIKDLRAMLTYAGEHKDEFAYTYGTISPQSIGAIQRALMAIENEGGQVFFGEPDFDIFDWIKTDENGRGYVNILHSVQLVQSPTLYAFFLLWMLSELFEKLPECGDLEKPKLVFFFDEAHLLFNDMPGVLLEKLVQMVKLIRSKGVGVYFVTQSPGDLPDEILAQLSNRVQHALRVFTPSEQKTVRAAAASFRENPDFRTEEVITQLGIGEALVSFLQQDGTPAVVQRAFILPPQSFMGAIDESERTAVIENSREMGEKYNTSVDRESAFEKITGNLPPQPNGAPQVSQSSAESCPQAPYTQEQASYTQQPSRPQGNTTFNQGQAQYPMPQAPKQYPMPPKKNSSYTVPVTNSGAKQSVAEYSKNLNKKNTGGSVVSKATERAINSAAQSIGRQIGNSIARGLFGSKR